MMEGIIDIGTIERIATMASAYERGIEFVILRDENGSYSFQPNYDNMEVGDIDLMGNIAVKKISYYDNNTRIPTI